MKVFSRDRKGIGIAQPQPAWRISAFLDGERIGQWDNWQLESPVFNADLITLGPGNHLLKIARNIQNALEITEWNLPDSNPIGLYYAEIPESFEPNLPVEVSGLNPHNKSFLITFANDLTGRVVETQTVSDAAVRLSVPGSILGDTFASVSLKDTAGDEEIIRSLTKPFDPNDWRHKKPRAVIICPDTHWNNYYDLFELRRRAIPAAARAFVNRGIDYCVLYKKDVTPENLQFVLGNRSVRYVDWVGHGNCYVGHPKIEEPIPRTSLNCWIKNKKVPAFSFTRRTIPYAPALLTAAGNNYDKIGFDLNSITIDGRPMREAGTKRLVVIDACSGCKTILPDGSGRYDMAWVFGAYNYQPHLPLTDQMNYIGWSIEVNASGGTIFQDDTTDRLKDFWEVLGSGNTLAAAYERIWNNSATASSSATLLPTFFGPDEINQYGKGDDHFKREGGGIKEQKLENR